MGRKIKYTKEYLEEFVKNSQSWQSLLRNLGLQVTGGNYANIQSRVRSSLINTSHFTGQAWNKGLTKETSEAVRLRAEKVSDKDEDVFVKNSKPITGTRLAKRLLRLGWEYKCSCCGINEWLGKSLTLHLDHINGTHNDNRFENLRFLCPNCHQQTDTWGNRKRSNVESQKATLEIL